MTQYEILKQYFGYDTFRDGQDVLINSILEGRDLLGVMPTGAGKSLCYQIPALMMDGITLVIQDTDGGVRIADTVLLRDRPSGDKKE